MDERVIHFGTSVRKPRGIGEDVIETFVLIEGDRVSTRSTAALRIAREFGLPWSLAYPLILIPRPLGDWAYDVVARNRYRWFGRRKECRVPPPEVKGRFVESS